MIMESKVNVVYGDGIVKVHIRTNALIKILEKPYINDENGVIVLREKEVN